MRITNKRNKESTKTATEYISLLLPPATKLRQGNVFTPVCQSFCSRGEGVSVREPPPPRQKSPWTETPGQTPPGQESPRSETPPRAEITPPYGNQRAVSILLELLLCITFKSLKKLGTN